MIDILIQEGDEQLREDQQKLREYQDSINQTFRVSLDNLHMKFLDEYGRKNGEVTFNQVNLIREVFKFLKEEA